MAPSSIVENRLQLHQNARDYDEIIRTYIDTILGKYFLYSNYYIFNFFRNNINDHIGKILLTLVTKMH